MNIVWHRRDLRTHDNRALAEAGSSAQPVFVFDPECLENDLVTDARVKFVLESLKDLNRQYVERGSNLALLHGNPVDLLDELSGEVDNVYFNRDANHFRQGMERRARKKFEGFDNSAVDTSGRDRSSWSDDALKWFEDERFNAPESLDSNKIESRTTIDAVRRKYEVEPGKQKFGEGGSMAARTRLADFLERIEDYSGCISSPSKAEASTSHLSPYIRHGCISPREVYQKASDARNDVQNSQSAEMFIDRVFWQQHFNQKIEDNPDLFREAVNPVYRGLNSDNRDQEKIEAWKRGMTGFPLVDASMRALVETGWLNFRMRAMCASFFSYILKQWWKIGADFFYKHLIDADVAINYYQWQMQSGLVGVHANRIYDPARQVEENDPQGEFIRKYVPELRSVPDNHIAEPWKMPERLQQKYKVMIGEDYPEPVVNYERESRKARSYFRKKSTEAYGAFEDEEVWRKASLSSRHDREEILENAGISQTDLKDFR